MDQNKFTWYEFFAGGGMARIGLGDQWKCAFSNEWSRNKATAYRAYFGRCPELKVVDVANLTTGDLPGCADMAWASFPCQDLSLAGNGVGLRGQRSGTFWPFWGLIKNLVSEGRKPRLIVLENVVGAITSHGGRDFTTLVEAVAAEGYMVGAMVVDAVHFVPQSRPRLFVIAADQLIGAPSQLRCEGLLQVWHTKSLRRAYANLSEQCRKSWVWWNLIEPDFMSANLSDLIEDEPSGVDWNSSSYTDRLLSLMSDLNRHKVEEAIQSGERRVGAVYRRTRPFKDAKGVIKNVQRAEVRFDGISGCLRTPAGGSSRQTILMVDKQEVRSRLLSPREAARLMGAPEEYPIPQNYNAGYHLFGDGLVVPVVQWLESHLLRPLAQAARKLGKAA